MTERLLELMRVVTLLLLMLLLFAAMPNAKAAGPPLPPCIFYGCVYVGGAPAQDGLNITAVISGATLNWTTQTKGGTYGWAVKGSSYFMIPSDNSATSEKDGGVTGDQVLFYVQDVINAQTAYFESGGLKRFDLSIAGVPGQNTTLPPQNITGQPTLSLYCKSSTTFTGFTVQITGDLTCNDIGLLSVPISLSYSVTGGNTWVDLTLVYTGSGGGFDALWMPSVTGNYLMKASWAGNATILPVSTVVNFAVIPFSAQNVFSVVSNSTVSALSFNSTSLELSFIVAGPPGTTGYVDVFVARSVANNLTAVKIFVDENEVNYAVTPMDDSWWLHFTYQHSTHEVVVSLASQTVPVDEFPSGMAIIGMIIIIAATVSIVVGRRNLRARALL